MQITIAPTIFDSVFIAGSLKLQVSRRSFVVNYIISAGEEAKNDGFPSRIPPTEKSIIPPGFRVAARLCLRCVKLGRVKPSKRAYPEAI
jgi:hypothetical protein